MANFFHLIKSKFFSKTEAEIMRIALPAIFESILTTLATMIDSKMVSSLGSGAISAISITNQPRLFMMTIFFAISTVVSILVANYCGKKDKHKANSVFFTGFIISVVLGALICGMVAACSVPIMSLFTTQHPELLDDASTYFFIVIIGSFFNIIFLSINAGLRGCGYTRLTFICSLVSTGTNILFNYMFIEGHWGAPRLEVAGAAIATELGFVTASIVAIVVAFRKKYFVNFKYVITNKTFTTKPIFLEMFKLWYKVLIENLLTRIGFLFSGFVIGLLPNKVDIAVYSIGMNFMNITLALGDGFSHASVALVGRSRGEQDYEKIKKYSFSSIRLGLVLSSILVIVFSIWGADIYSIFTKKGTEEASQIIALGKLSSYVLAVVAPIQTVQVLTNGIYRGMGDVKFPLIAAVISVTLINPITSYLFAIVAHLGVWGIWISVLISQLARMLILVIYLPKRLNKTKAEIELKKLELEMKKL